MSALLPFDQACQRIFGLIEPLGIEFQDSRYADGFVLAEDLVANRTSPWTALSAMDGYAVRAQDVVPGQALIQIGESAAGNDGSSAQLSLAPGTCVRIFTGAPLPQGADAVLIQEHAQRADNQRILPTQGLEPGRYVRPKGMDFTAGTPLLTAGTTLGPQHLGLLISAGIAKVRVRRQPVIEIISTGDELVEISDWHPDQPHRLPSSNGSVARAVLSRYGFGAFVHPIVPDRLDSLDQRIKPLRGESDLVISTGGASVGDYDIVRQYLEQQADEIFVTKIAMRPGKPVMLARLGTLWWLALPGNPVSSFVTTLIFGVGIAHKLAGHLTPWPRFDTAPLGTELPANDQRLEFMRATMRDGTLYPFVHQDSSVLTALAKSDALMIRPAHAAPAQRGDQARYLAL